MRILVLGALACALSVSACSKVGDQTSASGTSGTAGIIPGELRIAIQREPNTLNPLLSANTTEGLLNRLSFDTLLSVDGRTKKTIPILATDVPTEQNGGISKDGLTITYHLHTGVKWHDGVPFTSKDVKFSWQAMMNNNNNVNERVGYEDVKSVDTPDDATVVFHLKHKFAPFINTVFAESDSPVCILPEHLLAKYSNLNQIPFNQLPVGTGPFKVARWVRGDHIDLVANDDYFRASRSFARIFGSRDPRREHLAQRAAHARRRLDLRSLAAALQRAQGSAGDRHAAQRSAADAGDADEHLAAAPVRRPRAPRDLVCGRQAVAGHQEHRRAALSSRGPTSRRSSGRTSRT